MRHNAPPADDGLSKKKQNMTDITFPSKPDKTIKVAEFDVEYGTTIKVRLSRVINGKSDYFCEILTEVPQDVANFIQQHVIAQANKKGVFDPIKPNA